MLAGDAVKTLRDTTKATQYVRNRRGLCFCHTDQCGPQVEGGLFAAHTVDDDNGVNDDCVAVLDGDADSLCETMGPGRAPEK